LKLVQFEELTLKNFLSFRDEVSINLPSSGLYLVRGENFDLQSDDSGDIKNTNGSGKSALLRSLLWVLFGESNKRGKADNVINKKSKKDTQVSLVFNIGESKYKIERYRKTQRGTGLNLYKFDGTQYIDESFSDLKLTQEKINELLGFNYETALYTLLVSKEYNTNLIETPWNIRSSFLESLLRIDALKHYVKFVKDKLSEDKKKLAENEKAYSISSGSVITLRELLVSNINTRKKSRSQDKIKYEQLIKESSEKIPINLIEDINKYIIYLNQLNQIKIVENNIDNEINKYLIPSINKYKKNKTSLYQHIKEYDSHKEIKTKPCDNCEKTLEICSSPDLLNALNSKIELTKHHVIDLRHSALQYFKKAKELKINLKNLKDNLSEVVLEEQYAKNVKKDISQNIDPTERYKHSIDLLKSANELKNKKYGGIELWEHLRKYWDEKKKKYKLLSDSKKLKHQVALGDFWESTLDFRNEGSLKNYIVAKVVPVFNNVLKSVLDIIFEGNMEVIFDNFWNESITYYNDNYDYMQLSLGEKAKLNLAVSLALFSLFRVNLGGTSLLFIDEAFSHIDEASIEKYISLLRTTYSIDTAIFIVSHEYGLRNFSPDATYIVSKKNGESLLRIG